MKINEMKVKEWKQKRKKRDEDEPNIRNEWSCVQLHSGS